MCLIAQHVILCNVLNTTFFTHQKTPVHLPFLYFTGQISGMISALFHYLLISPSFLPMANIFKTLEKSVL